MVVGKSQKEELISFAASANMVTKSLGAECPPKRPRGTRDNAIVASRESMTTVGCADFRGELSCSMTRLWSLLVASFKRNQCCRDVAGHKGRRIFNSAAAPAEAAALSNEALCSQQRCLCVVVRTDKSRDSVEDRSMARSRICADQWSCFSPESGGRRLDSEEGSHEGGQAQLRLGGDLAPSKATESPLAAPIK